MQETLRSVIFWFSHPQTLSHATAWGQIKNQENKVRGPHSLITDKCVISNPRSSSGLVYLALSTLHPSWGLQWGLSCLSSLPGTCSLSSWEHVPHPGYFQGAANTPAFLIHGPVLCSFGTLRYLWKWREFLFSPGSPTSSLSHSPSSFSLFNICKFLSNHLEKWSM